jgi:hypothetical protein
MLLGIKIMTLSKELLEILACPKCKGDIKLTEKSMNHKEDGLICENCRLLYPIRDGIPVMLIDEAIKVGEK